MYKIVILSRREFEDDGEVYAYYYPILAPKEWVTYRVCLFVFTHKAVS